MGTSTTSTGRRGSPLIAAGVFLAAAGLDGARLSVVVLPDLGGISINLADKVDTPEGRALFERLTHLVDATEVSRHGQWVDARGRIGRHAAHVCGSVTREHPRPGVDA